jgi:pullulanase/glycogen debranching enzyme
MKYLRTVCFLILALGFSLGALQQLSPIAAFNHTAATVDATVSSSEYAGNNSGNWYMTWNNTDLYVGISGATVSEGAVLYIDYNPITPANGGSNSNGTLVGFNYDGAIYNPLLFRADFVVYFKNGYYEYRTANGSGGWSSQTTSGLTYSGGSGSTRELNLPWSVVTGSSRPATFNWFGYVTSSSGFVYNQTPSGNPSGTIGTTAQTQYYAVADTGATTSSNPFGAIKPPVSVSAARAIWLDKTTIAWNNPTGSSYKLLYDPDGGLDATAGSTACPAIITAPCYFSLTASGTVAGASYPKNPNANGLTKLVLSATDIQLKTVLKGQVVVAAYDGSGILQSATFAQLQSILDVLYASAAKTQTLGLSYSADVPTLKVWAPTAKTVTMRLFADSTTGTYTTHALTEDSASGVWAVTGVTGWEKQFYLLDVEVYYPDSDTLLHNIVTDPYSVNLSADTTATTDPRSQFVNLSNDSDSTITPSGWTTLTKPALAAPEDISIYEVHIRDFSINDSTVPAAERGTYKAFTYTTTNGMKHLLALQAAGLTHIHLLPTFDIASVNESGVARTVSPNPTGFGRSASAQQSAVGTARDTDGFNWGYDPLHYGAPEGSYSTNPDGVTRIFEFRQMVQALNNDGLRVVMDVVYNHTAAVGLNDHSVLSQVVPGYYHRLDSTGVVQTSSCCADTASEYDMMEHLMRQTLKTWVQAYKVDGFRFDLMNFHTRTNIENIKADLAAIDSSIYVYGEGWDFGSLKDKGVSNYAKYGNMTGAGIGAFNDQIRDAVHGGFSTDPLQIRTQGFINGLSYEWNGYCYTNRNTSDLNAKQDLLRQTINGSGTLFTDDPQETINYVEKHDNETLFDQNVFKLPNGTGAPGDCGGGAYSVPTVSLADRVRAQNLGTSIVLLSQGIPFIQMGQDILRSKSLDRNSYDSGDWFNRVDWSYSTNYFGSGLPPTWDNNSRWAIMTPLLNNSSLDPGSAEINAAAANMREMLRIRKSSPLFRLRTEAEINARITHYNTDNAKQGLLAYSISDMVGSDIDPTYDMVIVFFNSNKISQTLTINDLPEGITLHPEHTNGVDNDPMLATATYNSITNTFNIPARSAAVFTIAEGATTIDWVGKMWPRGGQSTEVRVGTASSALNLYVQVYEPGITGTTGSHTGLTCYLTWGQYGAPWTSYAMTRNTGFAGADAANNDEWMINLSATTLNNLTVGTYGFNTYCSKPGESPRLKQDSTGLSPMDIGDGILSISPLPANANAPSAPNGVMVHLFEWKWTDIQKECTYLSQKGYTAVQVSPPMEHVIPVVDQGDPNNDFPWWVRYQAASYSLATSRSGSLAEFQAMVNTCNGLGVDIFVDAIVNHTTGVGSSTGTAGTTYNEYSYPGPDGQYNSANFHHCGTNGGDGGNPNGNNITNYANRYEVQNCELVNLADLDTSQSTVQAEIRAYLQVLLNMGVKGFRLDAAKHMFTHDITGIIAGLTMPGGGTPYIYQEVIEAAGEPVMDFEYYLNGDVTEFGLARELGNRFNKGTTGCTGSGTLADLQNMVANWSLMPSEFALVFTDNHDNQRGHGAGGACIADYRDGIRHELANIFLLASPYGYAQMISSYYWDGTHDSYGPPSTSGNTLAGSGASTYPVYGSGQVAGDLPSGCDASHWVCEHRRQSSTGMVGFRAVTAGQAISDWQNIGAASTDHIAFGRGVKGFVAINNTGSAATTSYTSSMAAGVYCDVTRGQLSADGSSCVDNNGAASRTITVDAGGNITSQALGARDAFAIDIAQQIGTTIETTVTDPAVAISSTVNVKLVVRNSVGSALSDIPVTLTITGGTGAINSSYQSLAGSTDGSGVASFTFNAPATTQVVKLTGRAGSLADVTYAYIASAGTTANSGLMNANTNPFTIGSLATYFVTATKNGTGTPNMQVATLATNPCPDSLGIIPESYTKSPFVDVLLEKTVNVTSVDITVKYNPNLGGSESNYLLYWCNPETGDWEQVPSSTIDASADTANFTVTTSTVPSLGQLEGTSFVVASADPTALQGLNLSTRSGNLVWIGLIGVLAFLGVATTTALLAWQRRKHPLA